MNSASARSILEQLVSFRTVSSESNLDLIEWVEKYLAGIGVESARVFNSDGSKANLFAMIGPSASGGVILSGHTDVVPVDGQNWSSCPWTLAERNGLLYGRGACDMNGFIASVLAAAPAMRSAPLVRPVQIALSYDEEIGCLGAPSMIEEIRKRFPPASAAIIGEPTSMKVATAHKGTMALEVRVRGHEVHSSLMHKGVSAVMIAARLIEWANQRNVEIRRKAAESGAAEFDPPYTTLHIGRIKGGVAQNITAKECRFELEIRCVPDDDTRRWAERFRRYAKEVESSMRRTHPETAIEIDDWFDVPQLRPESSGCAETLARRLTGDNATHVMSCGTEAGQFQEHGYSAVVCGPGDIETAHKPDEHLSVSQLEAAFGFMQRLTKELCA